MVITQIGYLKYITECVKNDGCPSKTSKRELNSLWKYFTSRSHLKSQNIGYKESNAWFLEMYAQEANTGLGRWLWWLSIQQPRPTSKSLSNGKCLSEDQKISGAHWTASLHTSLSSRFRETLPQKMRQRTIKEDPDTDPQMPVHSPHTHTHQHVHTYATIKLFVTMKKLR